MTDDPPKPPTTQPLVSPDAPTRPLPPLEDEAARADRPAPTLAAKILIADDHAPLREALREVLAASFPASEIIEAATAEEATALAEQHAPDLVIMDLRLPQMNGIAATRLIKRARPETRVVMLSQHEDEAYQAQAGAAGASGYIYKSEINKVLVPLIEDLLRQGGGKE